MANTINVDGSSGILLTPDGSTQLDFQSNGTTQLSVNPTNTTFNTPATFTGSASFGSNATFTGSASFGSNATFTGSASFGSNATFTGDATFNGAATFSSGIGSTSIPANNITGTISPSRMPSGSVLQVQHHVVTSNYTGTGGTNRDFPAWDFTFTPNLSTSKVFVMISVGINMICDGNVYLKRDGTIVKDTWFGSTRDDDVYDYPQASAFYLDSPATASAINYKVGGRATGCGQTIRFGGSDNHASMTFMEVAG